MFDWTAAGCALAAMSALSTGTWLLSLSKRDVSIIDSMWSLFLLAGTLVYSFLGEAAGLRRSLVLGLVCLWAVRLCVYLTWRNWGQPEDRRYQAIRQRNEPGFEIKSLIYVFALQAVLAWIVSWPLLPAVASGSGLNWLDLAGILLFTVGLVFETVADWQMARFRADPDAHGRVLDRGLWRYSRHPNYFGECLVWWGFFGVALGAGAPLWTVVSPMLMTLLLLKISGVPLLERDLTERKPEYQAYASRTSAFLPWPPCSASVER
jgi:steroid 5-alpha reductase family enzyme